MYICWSYEWILARSLVVAQRFQAQLVRFYSFSFLIKLNCLDDQDLYIK